MKRCRLLAHFGPIGLNFELLCHRSRRAIPARQSKEVSKMDQQTSTPKGYLDRTPSDRLCREANWLHSFLIDALFDDSSNQILPLVKFNVFEVKGYLFNGIQYILLNLNEKEPTILSDR